MSLAKSSVVQQWLHAFILACGVFLLGVGAVFFAPSNSNLSAWWPAVGFSVAYTVGRGKGFFPFALPATFLATAAANISGGRPELLAVLYATINAIEVFAVASLVLAAVPQKQLRSVEDLLRVTGAAITGAAFAGIFAGVVVHAVLDGDFYAASKNVLASHLSAILIFLPLGLRPVPDKVAGPLETGFIAAAAGSFTALLFSPQQSLPVVFMLFPLLMVTTFRLTMRSLAALLVILNVIATTFTAQGWGPIAQALGSSSLPVETMATLTQLFLLATTMSTYTLRLTILSRATALNDAVGTKKHLASVIEAANSTAIIQVNLNGVIEVFNTGATNLLGYSEQEMVGKETPEVFHDGEEIVARAQELGIEPGFDVFVNQVRTGQSSSEKRDWTFITKDGERKRVSLTVSPVTSGSGTIVGFLGVAEDVEQQRVMEELLLKALKHERDLAAQLRAADELKDEFIACVSHELRTPLTSVVGYTEIVADSYAKELGPDGARLLDKIQTNGDRLLTLIDDILTLSRLESGAWTLEPITFDAAETTRKAAAVLAVQAITQDIILDTHIPASPVWVQGDPREIERCILNLLSNSVKFTQPGGKITVMLQPDSQGIVTITVADTGVGVPPEDVEHLFTRFFRAANATLSAIPGTGLGLAITHAIIERHSGTIQVSSELGKGTSITVMLPTVTAPSFASFRTIDNNSEHKITQ